jgi:hypothetical protein
MCALVAGHEPPTTCSRSEWGSTVSVRVKKVSKTKIAVKASPPSAMKSVLRRLGVDPELAKGDQEKVDPMRLAGSKRRTVKKSTAKKSTAKKSTAKKSTAKKSTAKKSTARKSTANVARKGRRTR